MSLDLRAALADRALLVAVADTIAEVRAVIADTEHWSDVGAGADGRWSALMAEDAAVRTREAERPGLRQAVRYWIDHTAERMFPPRGNSVSVEIHLGHDAIMAVLAGAEARARAGRSPHDGGRI